ncbi:MAG: VOC family protein [Massiliimalia sp.]|jgi:methylmalonyl-CoA/ethylmalonyl-CoA epimerase
MMEMKFFDRHVKQVGFLTWDIEKTTRKWAEFLHTEVPPIHTCDTYEKTKAEYRGAPCYGRVYQSFFEMDNIQIELIQPMDFETPSYWLECLKEKGEGLHHIAYEVKDMKANIEKFEQQGMVLTQKGEYPGGRYAYLDDLKGTTLILELLENDDPA